MLGGNKQIKHSFHSFMLLFIILQPVLDLLTSYFIMQLDMSATIGVFVRFAVMMVVGVYILLQWKEQNSKKYIIYLGLLGVVLTAGLVNNFFVKDPMSIVEEVKFIGKIVYTYVMLVGYIFVLRTFISKEKAFSKLRDYIVYSVTIVNIIMVVSMLTGTDYNSYDYTKLGSKGWFFAANDLGAVLAISFPIVILYSIQKTTSISKLFYWIPSFLSIYSLVAMGTKVGYGAVVGVLAVAVVMCASDYFMNRKKGSALPFLINGAIVAVLLVSSVVLVKQTPIYKNLYLHIGIMDWKSAEAEQKRKIEKPNEKPKEVTQEEKQQEYVEGLIFSSRDQFVQQQKKFFSEAPISQKILGMGYAGNYVKEAKMIEMDFHDMFYSFGYIGFLVLMLPLLYFGIRILIMFVKKLKDIFNVKYGLIATSIMLALGIAYIAGHVFTSPAVAIYLVTILAYLIVDVEVD
jgi:hypothetical protein